MKKMPKGKKKMPAPYKSPTSNVGGPLGMTLNNLSPNVVSPTFGNSAGIVASIMGKYK